MKSLDSQTVNAVIVTITPDLAQKWLSVETKNRSICKEHRNMLVHAIESGQWKLNGSTIVLARDGSVIDGQHRLNAVVHCGKSIESIVVFNSDKDSIDTIDVGRKRTAGDLLSMRGEVYSNYLAAALSLMRRIKNKTLTTSQAFSAKLLPRLILSNFWKRILGCAEVSNLQGMLICS
jgi:hypothetical protein